MTGYLITNLVNGKRYVGKTTKTLALRWRQHLAHMKSHAYNSILHAAIRKYGAENFTIDPLSPARYDLTKENDLNEWECLMIRLIGTKAPKGYNLTDGGDGTSGRTVTEEEIRKRVDSEKEPSVL